MTAADRPSVTDDARAENMHDPCCSSHGVTMPCSQYRRTHFVEVRPCCDADADLLAAGRAKTTTEDYPDAEGLAALRENAETTTATVEDAEEVLHGKGWFARADLDPRDLHGILHDLAEAGLLATARPRPTREVRP